MNLVSTLAKHNRKLSDITRIYSGKENCCRCGCGGRYFEHGTVGFKRALTAMQKPDFKPLPEGADMQASYGIQKSRGVEFGENYCDIPYNAENDKCYCLYFD